MGSSRLASTSLRTVSVDDTLLPSRMLDGIFNGFLELCHARKEVCDTLFTESVLLKTLIPSG